MSDITLTPDQQTAYDAFAAFVLDPVEQVYVLSGYAGTGKSTLVKRLLDDLPAILKTGRLIDSNQKDWDIQLTATTNKAAEALEQITQREVTTIHSALELRVYRDFKTGATELKARTPEPPIHDSIVFVDEASYVDSTLLGLIGERTHNCKLVFIGDPAQLTPVKYNSTPVFVAGFPEVRLHQVVRQAEGNPIIELATAFRNTVNTGDFFSFAPDGVHIQHHDRDMFGELINQEFTRGDWQHNDSKVLAWTNKTVVAYNHAIRNLVEGVPELQEGDYAICNHHLSNKHCRLRTDQMVQITGITPHQEHGVDGYQVTMDHRDVAFLPRRLENKKVLLRQAKRDEDYGLIQYISEHWVDLRAAYACTINKSQGSTYDRVFIDLDDIKRCNSANQIARMLYVAVSRAREQVIFTGDLV